MTDNILPVQIEILPPDESQIRRAMADIEADVAKSGRRIGESRRRANKEQEALGAYNTRVIKAFNKAELEDKKRTAATQVAAERAMRKEQEVLAAQNARMEKAWNAAILEDKKRALQAQVAAEKQAAKATQAASAGAVFSAAGITDPQKRIASINAIKQAQMLARQELSKGNISLGQYNLTMEEATKRLNLFEFGNVRARGAVHQFVARMASLTFELTGAIYGFGILAATLASPALFGINFLRKLEDTKLGMAGILTSMGEVNGRMLTFAEASEAANEQIDILAREAINLAGTLEDFSRSYQAILAPGLAAGLKLDEIRKVAIAGTVAVKSIGLDSRQIVQEIRDLVAGGIQAASSTLATSLGLTDKDIKAAKLSAEGLFTFLTERLDGFVKAAERRPETLSGKIEQLWETFTQALASQSKFAFDATKQFFDLLISKIAVLDEFNKVTGFNPEFISGIQKTINALTLLGKGIVFVLEKLWEFRDLIFALAIVRVGSNVFGALISGATKYKAALLGAIKAQKALKVASIGAAVTSTPAIIAGASNVATTSLGALGVVGKAKNLAKAVIGAVGKTGIIGLVLWGLFTAWGWWRDYINAPIEDAKKAAKDAAAIGEDALEKLITKERAKLQELEQRKTEIIAPDIFDPNFGINPAVSAVSPLAAIETQIKQIKRVLNEYQTALDKLKADKAKKASESLSNSIRRMNGSLIDAQRALENLGEGYYKSYKDAEDYGNAILAVERAQKDLNELQKLSPQNAEEAAKHTKRIKDYKETIDTLRFSLRAHNKLEEDKLAIINAQKGPERERAQADYERSKKLIELQGVEDKLKETQAIAAKQLAEAKKTENAEVIASIAAYKKYIDVKLKATQIEREQVATSDPFRGKAFEFSSGLRRERDANVPIRGASKASGISPIEEDFERSFAKVQEELYNNLQEIDDHAKKSVEYEKRAQEDKLIALDIYWQKRSQLEERKRSDERAKAIEYGVTVAGDIASILSSVSQVYENKAARQIDGINKKYDSLASNVQKQIDDEVISKEEGERRLSSLEKQRDREADAIGRRQFERNKKFQRAITIISTAAAIIQALSDPTPGLPYWVKAANAAAAAAVGVAQLAVINSSSYQGGGSGSYSSGANTSQQPNNIIPQQPNVSGNSGPTIIINNPTSYNVEDTVQFFADVFKQATDDQLVNIEVAGQRARVI